MSINAPVNNLSGFASKFNFGHLRIEYTVAVTTNKEPSNPKMPPTYFSPRSDILMWYHMRAMNHSVVVWQLYKVEFLLFLRNFVIMLLIKISILLIKISILLIKISILLIKISILLIKISILLIKISILLIEID